MKNNMNRLRQNFDSTEITDEGQNISDFYSPLKTKSHTDRFIPFNADSKEFKISEKTPKNEEI